MEFTTRIEMEKEKTESLWKTLTKERKWDILFYKSVPKIFYK